MEEIREGREEIREGREEIREGREESEMDKKLGRWSRRFSEFKKKQDENFNIDDELKKLLPKSGMAIDFLMGPNERKSGESFTQYKFRQKLTNYIIRLRLKNGIRIIASNSGTYRTPAAQQQKLIGVMEKTNRKSRLREFKKHNGRRMTDFETQSLV